MKFPLQIEPVFFILKSKGKMFGGLAPLSFSYGGVASRKEHGTHKTRGWLERPD
jgi:hypothetical protein